MAAPLPAPGLSPRPAEKLRHLAFRGSAFEVVAYGVGMAVRLGSNMVVSRFLSPSAFGLMALVTILVQGLIMLSDVGIEPAVVQSERGDDRRFLDTAWTMQVVRGLALYAVVLVVAWPMAALYAEPDLFALTCVGAVSLVFAGLNSTSLLTLRRHIAIGRLAGIELAAQMAAVAVMVPWAYLRPTVWALVGGSLAYSAFKMVASHCVSVGQHPRLGIDPDARRAITQFGKWIMASSAFYFVSRQADRILLGSLLGVAELGIYSIALTLSEAVSNGVMRVTHGVLFPALSRIRLEGDARLRSAYRRARLLLDLASLPALGLLTVLGPWVVRFLYDSRYEGAGWILQAFAIRVAMNCMIVPADTCLTALGMTRFGMYENLVRMLWIFVTVPLGWHFWGLQGIVWAAAASELPMFLVVWPPLRKAGMLDFGVEFRALALYGVGIGAGLLASLLAH